MNVRIKKQSRQWNKIVQYAGILIFLIIFFNVFQSQIRNSFYFVSQPISNIFLQSGSRAYNFFSRFSSINKLQKENYDLKKEKQDLLLQVSVLQNSLKKYGDLEIALQNIKNSSFKIVMTKTIGLDIVNDLIVIDRGSTDGILENMPLISQEKIVYGRIFKVYKNFSQVLLISARTSAFNVKILENPDNQPKQESALTQKTVYGIVRGKGRLSLYLDLVDFNSEIKERDTLVTSGLEGIFPENLLVGQITSVNKNDLKPFQTAEIQPFFDTKNLENLFIITNYP